MDNKHLLEKRDGSLGFYMGRTKRTLDNRINKEFQDAGILISIEHWVILMNLWIEDGLHQQELAEKIYKDKASIARLLSVMELKDLLVRVPDQNDKRIKRIYLTHAGKALQDPTIKILDKLMEEALYGIEEKEIQVCKEVMSRIYLNMTHHTKNEVAHATNKKSQL